MRRLRAILSNIRGAVVLLALLGAGQPATAFDTIVFLTPGAPDEVRERLVEASLLVQARRDRVGSPDQVLAAARADYARMVGVLYGFGRYGGTVSISVDGREAAGLSPLAAPTSIGTVRVSIDVGPVYRFNRAEIGPLAPGTALPEGFVRGRVATSDAISEASAAAIQGWRQSGHPSAQVGGQTIVADHRARSVSAAISLAPGPAARFGDLQISGAKRTRPARIRDIAGYPEGQAYDPRALETSARRLRRTGTFSSVAFTEDDAVAPDGTLDVTLELAEQKTRRIGVGIEIGSTEGLTVSGFWLHRNLLKGAEQFRVDGEIAGIGGETGGLDYSLGARFTRPGTRNPDTDLFVLGSLEQKNEPDFNSKSAEFGFGLRRDLRDRLSGEAGVLFSYTSVSDAAGTEDYSHIYFPVSAIWDRRSDALNPTDGFFLSGRIAPFLGVSGSESGAKLTLDARGYEPVGDRLTLAARVQVGSIMGASITGLPNDERFTSGGGGTVRGQEYQSLGIDLGGGLTSGGRSFLGVSGELRYAVTDTISVVGFADWGSISASSTPGVDADDHAGAGIGLRYNTGIGPIRFDLATPIGGEEASASSYQIYIGIGQAF